MFASLTAYVIAATLLTITPGADTLLVVRHSAAHGRAGGLAAAAGILVGLLVWGAIVAAGVAALIVAQPVLFNILRIAGALYLVWLGIQLLMVRPRHAPAEGRWPSAARQPFLSGLLTNMMNPKVGAFYLAFLPQFVPAGAAHGPFILLLAAIHALLGLVWFALLICGVGRAAPQLRNPRISRVLARLTGALFVGFGARLLLDSR